MSIRRDGSLVPCVDRDLPVAHDAYGLEVQVATGSVLERDRTSGDVGQFEVGRETKYVIMYHAVGDGQILHSLSVGA